MGKHFVPRKYLKGFAVPDSPDTVWQFDKTKGAFGKIPYPISDVAQKPDFYPPDVEEKITTLIESPVHPILDKLRAKSFSLTEQERAALAAYIATMMMRVPRKRERARGYAPGALETVTNKLMAMIDQAEADGLITPGTALQYRAETEAASAKYALETPQEVLDQVDSPFPTPNMVHAVFGMEWRFVVSDGTEHFITSDNPAFYFECDGLANRSGKSELTFPISDTVALFGSWQAVRRPSDRIVTKNSRRYVKEANRRVAHGASRFIYARQRYPWVAQLAERTISEQNRIIW